MIMKLCYISLCKWLTPILSYAAFLACWFPALAIENMICDYPPPEGPTFPPRIITLIALPFIPAGYFMLPVAQIIFNKSRLFYWMFAFLMIAVQVAFLMCLLGYFNLLSRSLTVMFYNVPFFLILSHVIKREHK
jgi:hypothetical protein